MASEAREEEIEEYESDLEEAKRPLAMRRRREASDDEGGDGERGRGEEQSRRGDLRGGEASDIESDGQGGVEEYYDDEEAEFMEAEELEEEEEFEEEEYVEEQYLGAEEEGRGGSDIKERAEKSDYSDGDAVAATEEREREGVASAELAAGGGEVEKGVNEEKKENEPFSVPTAGAFYMHDDRFRDHAGGRHRRMFGGKKLWEDEKKWGHDKFEEMKMQERHYDERRRNPRGNYRGRGKNRGAEGGYPRGSRSKVQSISNNQNQAPKSVRGRGPRRYEASLRNNNEMPQLRSRQSGKYYEKALHANSGRVTTITSKVEPGLASLGKHVFASSLNSASPPFYPSGSSTKDMSFTQKRDIEDGNTDNNIRAPVIDESVSVLQSNALFRGKSAVEYAGMDKLSIDDSVSSATAKPSTNVQLPSLGSSFTNLAQVPKSRAQRRGVPILGQKPFQSMTSQSQVIRTSSATQLHGVQRSPIRSRVQSTVQTPVQPSGARSTDGSRASSPSKAALSINLVESGEMESTVESSKPKIALVGKGKGSIQGGGKGSFLYNGVPVMGASGNMNAAHGDQNFPGAPAFLPVMQFGGQHTGGIGVPAVGMAFPGYVAQPQLGLGNSEMTWLPVLAGAPGALGPPYCSPYIAVDGAYHAHPSGQKSSASSSREESDGKQSNGWKSLEKSELVGDEFGQRQNKPRRYSEMNFGQ